MPWSSAIPKRAQPAWPPSSRQCRFSTPATERVTIPPRPFWTSIPSERRAAWRTWHIALVGDLKYGRTVHSLAYALSLYGADITLVSPPTLRMPDPIKTDLSSKGTIVRETSDLGEVIDNVDVLYMTRIQRERFPDPVEYQKVASSYRITPESLAGSQRI